MGQQHRVGQTVGHPELAPDGVGKGVDISHIGAGKGHTGKEGGGEQGLPPLQIGGILPHLGQILEDKPHRDAGLAVGLLIGIVRYIGLQGVGQGIQRRIGGGGLGQAYRQLRVQNGKHGHQLGVQDLFFAVGGGI